MAKSIALAGALLLGAALTACGGTDARLKQLTVGISRDSALKVMGVEAPARVDPYLMNGHRIEALYFAKPGADRDKLTDRKMAPLVVVDGVLAGWGWPKWDSIAGANSIQVKKQ